ncbi:MAG: hypothetical protein P1S60_06715 [Anaerolineae bacterium]|nr:hypothetical protein [Anaerolineae bacterium]
MRDTNSITPDSAIFADWYADDPIIRALAALLGSIPGVGILSSPLDAAIVAAAKKAKSERLRTLIDGLMQNKEYLTEELIQQEEFIYAFMAVARASVLAKRREKIHLFAQLLINACKWNKLNSDDFDEYLQILEELSVRELLLLRLYQKHEERLKERVKTESGGDYRKSQWNALADEAEAELGIPRDQLSATLSRLART